MDEPWRLRENGEHEVAVLFEVADDCMNLGAMMNVESVSQWRGDCCP